jgi:hypothetical protein
MITIAIDPSFIINVAVGIFLGIWGFKFTKGLAKWLLEEYLKH